MLLVAQSLFKFVVSPLNTALLVAICFLIMQARSEELVFSRFSSIYVKPGMSTKEIVYTLSKATNERDTEHRKTKLYKHFGTGFLADGGGIGQLLCPQGACGSASMNFVALCHANNISARVCQVQHNGSTVHVFAEALVDGRWIATDPLFGIVYTNPDGTPATVSQLQNNWADFKNQIPDFYTKQKFSFASVVRTNWQKNKLMAVTQKVLQATIGQQNTDAISLRTLDAQRSRWAANLAIFFLILTNAVRAILTARKFRWKRIPTQPHRPVIQQPAVCR